jgi:energy-converting hydrogenase Eha subunit H
MADARRPPGLGRALRDAAVDLYYHSIRLVPANLAWGAVLLLVLVLASQGAWLAALLASPLLALALVGIARLAGLIARREEVVLSDAWSAARERARPTILVGVVIVASTAILGTNVLVGLATGTPTGFTLAVLAGWGLLGLWLTGLPFWILLADPARSAWSAADVVRLTGLLLLARPLLLLGLGLAFALVVLLGAILVAALLIFAVAYAALVTAHVILPAADRLTAQSSSFPALPVEPPVMEPSAPD